MVKYSRTPQIVYSDTSVGRTTERSNPVWQQRFPAHARHAHLASDSPGPYGQGVWRIYPADWHPSHGAKFGFKHRNQWFQRVQERDPRTQELRWVTNGSVDVVAYSS
jgi:hypothetical protein